MVQSQVPRWPDRECRILSCSASQVTDHAFALTLSLLRRTTQQAALIKSGVWDTFQVGNTTSCLIDLVRL